MIGLATLFCNSYFEAVRSARHPVGAIRMNYLSWTPYRFQEIVSAIFSLTSVKVAIQKFVGYLARAQIV